MLVAMKPLMGRKCFPSPLPEVDNITKMNIITHNPDFKRIAQVVEEEVVVSQDMGNKPKQERKVELNRGMKMEPRGPGGF